MNWIVGLLSVTALVVGYITWLRPWLRSQDFARPFFDFIEPIELALWRKSETILWARFLQVVGLVSTVAGIFGAIDWTMITPLVPEPYQNFMPLIPLVLNLIGTVTEKLRRDTTKPLEVVAVPVDAPPEIKRAVAQVEATNAQAVAEVKEAKSEGAM